VVSTLGMGRSAKCFITVLQASANGATQSQRERPYCRHRAVDVIDCLARANDLHPTVFKLAELWPVGQLAPCPSG
jgi:hypothetical protein